MKPAKLLAVLDATQMAETINERGNRIRRSSHFDADRYYFDLHVCTPGDGWEQFDTHQDAWYFGVWVHKEARITVTYCEGDVSFVECPTVESYNAEMLDAIAFYRPGFIAKTIDTDTGEITRYEQDRNDFLIPVSEAA